MPIANIDAISDCLQASAGGEMSTLEGGKCCGDLHALLPGGLPLRRGFLHFLMSHPAIHGIQIAFSNLP